ncbi:MAG: PASTA domain-containing protein, partial [Clostridia bacterium]|nr:PASTA domain-containing protein [Clostridia bacterium]
ESGMVVLYNDKNAKPKTVKMPNLMNKTVSEATDALKRVGLNIRIKGGGTASKQEHPEGTVLEAGEIVNVDFIMEIRD